MKKRELQEIMNSVRLTERERTHMKSELFYRANLGYHGRGTRRVRSPFYFILPTSSFAALAVVMLIISSLASASLPGDSLYGFKRGVNERVLGVFAFTPSAKAKVETDLIARRFEEIEKVIDESQTSGSDTDTSETSAIIASLQEDITDSHAKVQVYIEEVSNEGDKSEAIEISTSLVQTVEIHTSIISSSVEEGSQVEADVMDVVAIVEAQQEEVTAQTEEIVLEVIVSDGLSESTEENEEASALWDEAIINLDTSIALTDAELEGKREQFNVEFAAQADALISQAEASLEECKNGRNLQKQSEDRIKSFLSCTNGLNDAKAALLLLTETKEVKEEKVEALAEEIKTSQEESPEIGDTILPPIESIIEETLPVTEVGEVTIGTEVGVEGTIISADGTAGTVLVPSIDPITGEVIMTVQASTIAEAPVSTEDTQSSTAKRQSIIDSIFSR